MNAADNIAALLERRDTALRQVDIVEIEILLAMIPVPEVIAIEETVWEAASLIINDPLYQGDARLPCYVDCGILNKSDPM